MGVSVNLEQPPIREEEMNALLGVKMFPHALIQ